MKDIPIKASGIRHLTDARYFASRDVDFLGFPLDPVSPDHLDIQDVRKITEWVEGPAIIAETGFHPEIDLSWGETLSGIQFFFNSASYATCQEKYPGWVLFPELLMQGDSSDLQLLSQLLHVHQGPMILNFKDLKGTKSSESAEQHPEMVFMILSAIPDILPFLKLSEPLENFATWKDALPVCGIDLSGSFEEKPGYKSFDELDTLFDTLESMP